ncbi:hypothetical protein BDW71DRAFT_186282 [Aspergillus fruticulosus]
MQQGRNKRRVTTCGPCQTRKQKCNRQYPCNHCTKRRRADECVYKFRPMGASRSKDEVQPRSSDKARAIIERMDVQEIGPAPMAQCEAGGPQNQHSAVAKSFGYFEGSGSNTMALLKNWDLDGGANVSNDESQRVLEKVKRDLERMPRREIIDFLVQYFVAELNWMKQLVHVPSFLGHYQEWWNKYKTPTVIEAELAVLILRICSYATQFLPSPSHSNHEIDGIQLLDIRNTCNVVGDSLSEACLILDWKGSLVRVQHILFAALSSSCEGRTDKFWEGISSACRAAQKAGVHTATTDPGSDGVQEFEKEMQRRTFCNLYLLDSHLSRQLDRVPFLPDNLVADLLPQGRFHPASGADNSHQQKHEHDLFTERLLQVHLGRFWRKYPRKQDILYDPTEAEQRYEQFCAEYLPLLPPCFSTTASLGSASRGPLHSSSTIPHKVLIMQRHLLHISIFDSIAYNFRPLLLLTTPQITQLPLYKRVLLQSQKQRLAHAALEELAAVESLHSLFGGGHTRFAAIIFNSFESAVLLLTLVAQVDFPFAQAGEIGSGNERSTILGRRVAKLTRSRVIYAVEKAHNRLQMLSGANDMAASGAAVVSRLLERVNGIGFSEPGAEAESTGILNDHDLLPGLFLDFLGDAGLGDWGAPEGLDPSLMSGFFSTTGPGDEGAGFSFPG